MTTYAYPLHTAPLSSYHATLTGSNRRNPFRVSSGTQCETMVATYNRYGIRFLYPENWTVHEESPQPQTHCVTLQSPGSGFWILQVLQTQQPPRKLAAEVLHSVRQDYDDVEAVDVQEDIDGMSSVGYDMQFYCLDFVVSSNVRSFSLLNRSYVLLFQAEDNEFQEMAPVFQAITTSLIQEARKQESAEDRES